MRAELIEVIMKNKYGNDDPKNYDNNLAFLDTLTTDELIRMANDNSLEVEEVVDGEPILKPNDYFKVVCHSFNEDILREEIEIKAGNNGKVFLIKTDEGFIIDVYDKCQDNINSMTIWEDDLTDLEE